MIRLDKLILTILLVSITIISTGCWNYREINQLSIVSGMAIDKGTSGNKYKMTVEVMSFSAESNKTVSSSKIIEAQGHNIFDAARNMIKTSPKKLYWGHTLTIIVSEALAKEGIIDVLDWISRDQETRAEANILISKEVTAKEILMRTTGKPKPIAFDIYDSLKAQKSLSKAPKVEIYRFINTLGSEGISSTLPSISLFSDGSGVAYEISGTSIFKQDKLVGFLDGEETEYFLFTIDEVKGGLLLVKSKSTEDHPNISLEIQKSKTKVKPDVREDELIMKIHIDVQVALAEIGTHNFTIDERSLRALESKAEKQLEDHIKDLIKKVQTNYDSDIFGFGKCVKNEMPEFWRSESANWDEIFKNLAVDVEANIKIKNSALTSKPIKLGD